MQEFELFFANLISLGTILHRRIQPASGKPTPLLQPAYDESFGNFGEL